MNNSQFLTRKYLRTPTFLVCLAALGVVTIDRQPEVEVEGGGAEEDCHDGLPSQVDQHHRHHRQAGDDQQVDAQPQDDQLQAGPVK